MVPICLYLVTFFPCVNCQRKSVVQARAVREPTHSFFSSPTYVVCTYVVESFKTALLIAVAVIRNMKQRSGWLAGQNKTALLIGDYLSKNHLLTEGCVSISEKKTLIDRTPLARSLCH